MLQKPDENKNVRLSTNSKKIIWYYIWKMKRISEEIKTGLHISRYPAEDSQ